MSPETSHLAALNLSFSKQKMGKNLLTLASPALGGGGWGCEGSHMWHLELCKIPKGNYGANDSEMKGTP